MQNQWHWDLRAVTGPAVYKPSCLSLSSPHFSAFFFLLNPGCIFSLNQTICLLAFLSSNKDSRDLRAPWVQEPSLAVPRWPKEGVKCPRVGPGGRVSGRVLSFLPEVACAKQCLLGKGLCLPLHCRLLQLITGRWGHLPAASCLLDADEAGAEALGSEAAGPSGLPGRQVLSEGMY